MSRIALSGSIMEQLPWTTGAKAVFHYLHVCYTLLFLLWKNEVRSQIWGLAPRLYY